jgi:hypothetical protein
MLARGGRHEEARSNIYGYRLNVVDRRAEARTILGEAVALHRRLAVGDRAGELPWPAQAVSNYALVLDDPAAAGSSSQEAAGPAPRAPGRGPAGRWARRPSRSRARRTPPTARPTDVCRRRR